MSDELLLKLADTAFTTLNWACRQGMKKPEQLEQVVSAFKKTIEENEQR